MTTSVLPSQPPAFPSTEEVLAFVQSVAPTELRIENFRAQRAKKSGTGRDRVLYAADTSVAGSKTLYVVAQLDEPAPGRRKARQLIESVSDQTALRQFRGFSQPAFYSDRLKLLIQIFPADRRLPFLREASDPAAMKPILHGVLGRDRSQLESVDVDVIRYKPELKCLFRYGLHGTRAGVCFAKVSHQAHSVYEKLRTIRNAYQGELAIPEPLGFVSSLRMAVCGELDGEPLSLGFPWPELEELCRTIARGLADLHETSVSLTDRKNTQLDRPRTGAWIDALAEALFELAPEIRGAGIATAKALGGSEAARCELVHGDFHVANILVGPSGVGLLDFENAHLGNAATDVASFCAQLKLLSLKLFRHHARLDHGLHAFLDEYLRHRPWCRRQVESYYAFYCLWCAHFQCVRRPEKPGWRERALAMARLAHISSTGGGLDV